MLELVFSATWAAKKTKHYSSLRSCVQVAEARMPFLCTYDTDICDKYACPEHRHTFEHRAYSNVMYVSPYSVQTRFYYIRKRWYMRESVKFNTKTTPIRTCRNRSVLSSQLSRRIHAFFFTQEGYVFKQKAQTERSVQIFIRFIQYTLRSASGRQWIIPMDTCLSTNYDVQIIHPTTINEH